MPDEQWEDVAEWETEQPIRCHLCGETFQGREASYLPAMCPVEACEGPPSESRRRVRVAPVAEEGPDA